MLVTYGVLFNPLKQGKHDEYRHTSFQAMKNGLAPIMPNNFFAKPAIWQSHHVNAMHPSQHSLPSLFHLVHDDYITGLASNANPIPHQQYEQF